ncbi:sulfotransferase [Nitrosococcus wardiae]
MCSTGIPLPFAIVADLRTGSTLLSSSLNKHPQICCRGELLHPNDLPDNQLSRVRRHDLNASELLQAAFDVACVRAAGFRAMIFRPDPQEQPQWAAFWDRLAIWKSLRVLFLKRRDPLAQYASLCIAQQTGQFHPAAGDPILSAEHRPRLQIDPDAFRTWAEQRHQLRSHRKAQLQGVPILDLSYEELVSQWDFTMQQIQRFLGVDIRPLAQAKQKQEQRPLRSVIRNYEQVRGIADHLPT